MHSLPPGTLPPLVITYNASSVPVLELALSGNGLSEQELFDISNNFLRTDLATVQGAAIPWPYGGKQPQVQVDIDSAKLQAMNLSPADVVNAFSAQNLILPSGTEKIGTYEYQIETNSAPRTIEGLNNLPIKTRKWRHNSRPGCRPRAQRFSAADQYCPRGRPARRPHDD